jgi:hypothetical protein
MVLAIFAVVLFREPKHGQGFAWTIPFAVTLGYTLALMMRHPLPGISIRFRQRSSFASIRDGGLQELPSTSPDIPLGADVDVSESGSESFAQLQEAPAPSLNEDGLDYNGISIHLRFFSDDSR